jgi:hypothetical protein
MKGYFFVLFLLSIFLTSCASLAPKPGKPAICNELKHRIIFNGATNDPQDFMKQRAELSNLDRTYRNEDCS